MVHISRFVFFLVLLAPTSVFADKTDIVILTNGDKITGEVKSLEGGLLSFSTDAMGTVNIEWQYIEQVISNTNQSIDTTDGRRFLGKLTAVENTANIGIETATSTIELPAERVFSAWPVEASYWDKSSLDISVGLDYSKSTDITDIAISADWEHREFDRLTQASLRSDITTQPDSEDQRRNQFQVGRQYLKPDGKFRTALANLETNESLGLDLRLYLGGMYGKYVLRRNDRWLSLGAGLVATQEEYTESDGQTSLEALGNFQFKLFRFADPERSLDAQVTVFPSLTESGRFRTDMRTTFKLDFPRDLFWSAEVYYQSDNKPPNENAVKSDWGITTSFGWSH